MSGPFAFVEECLKSRETVDVVLVIPLHGSAGMFGPSCELCARLAVEEVNRRGGVLARELRFGVVDVLGSPASVADEVGAARQRGAGGCGCRMAPLVGSTGGRSAYRRHDPVRVHRVVRRRRGDARGLPRRRDTRDPASTGDELAARRVHGCGGGVSSGTTTSGRVTPPGPRCTYAKSGAGEIVNEIFVPLGTSDFQAVVRRVRTSAADAVLMLLVGEERRTFQSRLSSSAGLDESIRRLSTLIDENTLLASGAKDTGICAAAAYFEAWRHRRASTSEARYSADSALRPPSSTVSVSPAPRGCCSLPHSRKRPQPRRDASTATADSVSFTGTRRTVTSGKPCRGNACISPRRSTSSSPSSPSSLTKIEDGAGPRPVTPLAVRRTPRWCRQSGDDAGDSPPHPARRHRHPGGVKPEELGVGADALDGRVRRVRGRCRGPGTA